MARSDPIDITKLTIEQIAATLPNPYKQFKATGPRYHDDLTEEQWAANDREHAADRAYGQAVTW